MPNGIHEQYVRLLTGIVRELDKNGGPELPTAWISGFYGSGKSSFAKLLGLALDGIELPDGVSLAEAWLRRDTSPRSDELREAWTALRTKVDPIAVVFDVGGVARDNEHIHAAALRQVQHRLGYSRADPLVADFELGLERDGEWDRFLETAERALDRPWDDVKDKALAEEDFSLVMSEMFPERYTDPMAWFTSRGGTHARSESPEDAVAAIGDMLRFRSPQSTLFLVVDEVSQYILANKDRVDRLRAFATALGARLRGKAWLLALGQQKLDEEADDSFLVWAKDRFPPSLRVHLAATNIRDVVHKRLLQKKPEHKRPLAALFAQHRHDLKLYAYGCRDVSPEEFVEVYPMLPGQIDLLLQITSALRTRSARAQGDDQAIRGLLQLLGELFRTQKLAEREVGHLVTLDQIYEVQHTALDSDVQSSMARILAQCADGAGDGGSDLRLRAAKAVALLELIQESGAATTPELVAQCLYDHIDRGNQVSDVTERARGAAPPQPPRLLGEGRLQDPVVCRRGVGSRAPRHARADRSAQRGRARHAQVPPRHAGAPALAGPPLPLVRPLLGRPARGGPAHRSVPRPGRDPRGPALFDLARRAARERVDQAERRDRAEEEARLGRRRDRPARGDGKGLRPLPRDGEEVRAAP